MRVIRALIALLTLLAFHAARAATPPSLIAQPCINPQSAFVFTTADSPSHVAEVAAGACRLAALTSGADIDQAPEWSFTGTTVSFQRNGADIGGYAVMTVPAGGGAATNISAVGCASAPLCGADIQPAWSPPTAQAPNGQVLFSVVEGCCTPYGTFATDIWVMNADGSGRTELLSAGATCISQQAAHVSPNGVYVAFECGPADNAPFQIYRGTLAYTSGLITGITGVTQLTSSNGCNSADPHWSPDSSTILFDSTCTTPSGVNLFTMTSGGAGVTQLTSCSEPMECQDGTFSSDGSRIFFEADWGGNFSANTTAPAAVWGMTSGGVNQRAVGVSCAESGCAPRFHP